MNAIDVSVLGTGPEIVQMTRTMDIGGPVVDGQGHQGEEEGSVVIFYYLSSDMRFPTMWYVLPAKAQTSLRIRAV